MEVYSHFLLFTGSGGAKVKLFCDIIACIINNGVILHEMVFYAAAATTVSSPPLFYPLHFT